jgi:hypothetical protein
LFSAVELAERGLTAVWDYQDDLSHGGSVPLLVLGALWTRTFGPSMLALKGIVIAWSAAALAALVLAMARACGGRAAALLAVFLLALAPDLARLQATLVGSHPEALLPAALALRVFAGLDEERATRLASPFFVGLWCGACVWMSLSFLPWMAALLLVAGWSWKSRPRLLLACPAGVLLGLAPWMYQNAYLRPHGAFLWRERLAPPLPPGATPEAPLGTLSFLPETWGLSEIGGWVLTATLTLCWVGVLVAILRGALSPARRRFAAVLMLGSVLSATSLWACAIYPQPKEGYYFSRFFVALQVQLLCLGALAVDQLAERVGSWLPALTAAAAGAVGVVCFAPLFGQGGEVPPLEVLLRRGCLVFGNAEFLRAGDPQRALARLLDLPDPSCREMACTGLGWALADDYLAHHAPDAARRTLALPMPESCKRRICGGLRFVLDRRAPAPELRTLPPEVGADCR